jgi:hypothetical protein
VVGTRETTLAEAKRLGIASYAVLTGDPQKDSQLHNEVLNQHTAALTPKQSRRLGTEVVPMALCTAGATTYGTSFFTGNGTRVYAELNYYRTQTCAVTQAVDRAWADGSAWWNTSAIGGVVTAKTYRGVNLNASWSAYYSLPDTVKGQRWSTTICNSTWNLGCKTAGITFY